MAKTDGSNFFSKYTVDDLKEEVLKVLKANYKVPGRISSQEINNFYNTINLLEGFCKAIDGSFINDSYYHGISWSRKSHKEIGSNNNESYQYYRSPYFSINYNSKKRFKVYRNEITQELRKSEADIDEFVSKNTYVYYAITVFAKSSEDSASFIELINSKILARIKENKVENGILIDIIPYPNEEITKNLAELTNKLKNLSLQINTISETMGLGFYLGGQRDIIHIQLDEDYNRDLKYYDENFI
jgi:hypothetical protein